MSNPATARRRIAVGIFMFLLLTAGGFAAVRWSAGPNENLLRAITGASRSLLLAAAGLVVLEIAFGGARFWSLGRVVHPGFRWRDGIHVNLYMIFWGGVTPMQLGAGPAQYLILRQKGLHAHDALAVLGLNWLGGLLAMLLVGGAGLWYLILDGDVVLQGLLQGLIGMVGVTILAALAVTFFPRPITRLLVRIRPLRRGRVGHRILRAIARYRRTLAEFRLTGRGREGWILNLAVSIVSLLLRCSIGVVVLLSLRVQADAVSMIARQAIQFAVMQVAPTPGGSGVAEVTTIGLMTGIVPATLIVSYTLLWRFFTSYAGILIGGVVVMRDLYKTAPRPEAGPE